MKNIVQFNDLKILFRIFFPAEIPTEICDPQRRIVFEQGQEPQTKRDVQPPHRVLVTAAEGPWKHKLDLSSPEFVLDFSNDNKPIEGYQTTKFFYRTNKNGLIRWVYPSESEFPRFLHFYHESDWKSKLYATYIHLVFLFGMGWLVSRKAFYIHSKSSLVIDQLLEQFDHEGYSIFLGSYGLHRKVTIEINKRGLSTHFVKVAQNDKMEALFRNEELTLNILNKIRINKMRFPNVETDLKALQNITIYGGEQMSVLSKTHLEAIEELTEKTASFHFLETSPYALEIRNRISALPELHRNPSLQAIFLKMKLLSEPILNNPEAIPFSMAHNDFTPYNIYVEEDRLDVYNWEMAGQAPMLTDIFHFIVQSEVFLHKANYTQIRTSIKNALQHPIIQSLIRQFGIQTQRHFHLYILHSISTYMEEYVNKDELSTQEMWRVNVWNDILDETIGLILYNKNFGQIFIKDLFRELADKKYAAMHWGNRKVSQLAEFDEVELLISEGEYIRAENFTKKFHLIDHVSTHLHSHCSIWEIYFKDASFLRMVFNFRLMQGNLQLVNHGQFLKEAQYNFEQVRVLLPRHEFEYVMVKSVVANTEIPANDSTYFVSMPQEIKEDIFHYIQATYYVHGCRMDEMFTSNACYLEVVRFVVKNQSYNSWWNRINNRLAQYNDIVYNLLDGKKLMISVEGLESNSKHQVVNGLKEILENKYKKKVVVIQQSRISKGVNGDNDDCSGFANLKSLAGDYWIALQYKSKGFTVIYEPKIPVITKEDKNQLLFNGWVPYLLKPDLNILLYSFPNEVIKGIIGKPETEADLHSFTSGYLEYFNTLSQKFQTSRYVSIHHVHVSETMANIEKEYLSVA